VALVELDDQVVPAVRVALVELDDQVVPVVRVALVELDDQVVPAELENRVELAVLVVPAELATVPVEERVLGTVRAVEVAPDHDPEAARVKNKWEIAAHPRGRVEVPRAADSAAAAAETTHAPAAIEEAAAWVVAA
jgi:hypothetical protein